MPSKRFLRKATAARVEGSEPALRVKSSIISSNDKEVTDSVCSILPIGPAKRFLAEDKSYNLDQFYNAVIDCGPIFVRAATDAIRIAQINPAE